MTRSSVCVNRFNIFRQFVCLAGFRADGYGAGQRVGQANYNQSGRGTQKTDAEVMTPNLYTQLFPEFCKFSIAVFVP